MDRPVEMRAVVCQGEGQVKVDTVMRPKYGSTEVLVKNQAIALNPTDWKSAGQAKAGAINGCDFCGTVEEMGADTEGYGIKVGDRVAGMLFGSRSSENGAFAEYVKHDIKNVWRVPDATSSEEAAGFGGIAITTAAQAFYIGRLGLPWPGEGTTKKTIVIWSGASSVGQYAIQLARIAGLTVVATASKKNHAHLKELGADHLYDYSDTSIDAQIAKEHPADLGLDCFAEGDSTKRLAACFGKNSGSIITLLPTKTEAENIKIEFTLVYTTLGDPFNFGPLKFDAMPEDVEGVAKWHKILPKLIEEGKLKPNKLRRCPGSLEKVHEGLAHMKAGKHSAEKLVYSVRDDFSPVPEPL